MSRDDQKTDEANEVCDIDALINTLSDDLKPVKKLSHPLILVAPWVVLSLAYIASVVNFLGLRMDIKKMLHDAAFLFEMGLTGIMALVAAYCAGSLASPDMRQQKWLLVVPSTLFGVMVLWTLSRLAEEGFLLPEIGWKHCFSDAMLMCFVPIVLLAFMVRRGTTTAYGWVVFMSTLAAGSLGWAALRLTCMAENEGHIMVFHFAPYILLAAVLGVLARRLYRW